MSERTDAPRSGGRAAQPRSTAGERGRGASRDAVTGGTGARGVRQSAGRSGTRGADTRRSGIGREERRETAEAVIEIEGTAARRLDTGEAAGPVLPRLRVAPPLPIRAPRPTFAAGLIVLVLVGVVGILLINTKTMEQSFRLDALRKNQSTLDEQQQELEQQLIQVSSPGSLAAAARRLGLVPAENPAMIRLPDGKIIRTPTPGKGQTSVTAQEPLTAGDTGAPATQATQGATGSGQPQGTGQGDATSNNTDRNAAGTGQ